MSNVNAVFYASSYNPIQAGSIDGTDILPHDNAVYRAALCSSAGLYDPFGYPKVTADPYCTLFVGRLSRLTDEETLTKAMSKYGRVKNLRLVRHIVTGASCGYAFVEYETEREMRRAYEHAHHSRIDDYEASVDYNRQQLMPGWIPRRLGGGLGGQKESGQLRFGGRERPFRAPLRPIPYDDLKRLGISPPPEGRYMSRFQIPSPPRRSNNPNREYPSSRQREDSLSRHRKSEDRGETSSIRRRSSTEREGSHRYASREEDSLSRHGKSEDRGEPPSIRRRSSTEREGSHRYASREHSPKRKRRSEEREERSSMEREGSSRRHHDRRRNHERSYRHKSSSSRDYH